MPWPNARTFRETTLSSETVMQVHTSSGLLPGLAPEAHLLRQHGPLGVVSPSMYLTAPSSSLSESVVEVVQP
jgi:hypothetical protein